MCGVRCRCKAKGEALPEHSAYDAKGEWTTDVADIPVGGGGGAIAGWGGHKGIGMALMIELLCAALSGGAALGTDEAPKKTARAPGALFSRGKRERERKKRVARAPVTRTRETRICFLFFFPSKTCL